MRFTESWPFSIALIAGSVVVCVLTVATALTYK